MKYYVIYRNSPRCKGVDLFMSTSFGGVGTKNMAHAFDDLESAKAVAAAFPDSTEPGHEKAEVVIGEMVLHVRDIR